MKLATRPLLTQSVTSAILFATGDTMAQQLIEKKGFRKHDAARTGRMALINSVLNYSVAIFGPVATTWFGYLQARIVLKNQNLEILARVAADQVIFASGNLFCFLSSMAIMEGSDPRKKLENNYTTALANSWMIWPFAQFINFKYVPLQHRVMVVNLVSLGWNCYLSSVAGPS
ncbi:hypothetical protein Golomagni_05830 [Golovinomyces magnicellulatus]|nr:hypothetical protein Golomagni_05830 [Golovinomyces magnicellulatus]